MIRAVFFVAPALALTLMMGCVGDVNWPAIELIEVVQADQVVTSAEPSGTSDTTIQDNVPTDASFRIYFDEPMALSTATDRLRIIDSNNTVTSLELTSRLEIITATPADGLLDPDLNHVLEIDSGIEDTTGHGTLRSYIVNFYTADM